MKTMLIVVSNHPPEKWEDSQKTGWDNIQYIPFPNVDPYLDDVYKLAFNIVNKIEYWLNYWLNEFEDYKDYKVFIWIQGDFSLTIEIVKLMMYKKSNDYQEWGNANLIYPTIERVVTEKENGEKISVFKFVKWREILLPAFY